VHAFIRSFFQFAPFFFAERRVCLCIGFATLAFRGESTIYCTRLFRCCYLPICRILVFNRSHWKNDGEHCVQERLDSKRQSRLCFDERENNTQAIIEADLSSIVTLLLNRFAYHSFAFDFFPRNNNTNKRGVRLGTIVRIMSRIVNRNRRSGHWGKCCSLSLPSLFHPRSCVVSSRITSA